ncbi:methionyl-tRNA formyltransferase [Corynebacterium sp. HMSC08F01]|uniref:Methionyl-tRNA formyltransferase n=1 Tax=Corynebacterium coyleae TaxID=53374 RepID=A0AAP6XIU5_9CORY|nr:MULTISPECIES: methionyl-tRNA formyltransferase [Corynebacterium]MDK8240691.1 methionyl-tRNA formyltransferase [Corynebacterium coyleae]MDK8799270.1 methionyl-tRNA formyltransferase [Corynebacterium coyleae]MDK8823052.1 methionyl-tRNA formyltransferase [Corynebacterium coyleae]NJJ03444.1 methionyl-tRNA formyltransferase [Corynebacterium coyleae]OFL16288.1 methionyl-tRNA formyltransferase [Corynebacterium sp. HMSC067D03]
MRLVFAGTPEPAAVALERLLASEHEVVAVLTRPDARKGRGRTLHPSPVKAVALEHGIEVLTPEKLDDDTAARLRDIAPDAIPVVAYGNLIPAGMLDIPTHGWVNLHFSLLPQWRGAAPVQAAIREGDASTGATTFRINEGLDTGDILDTLTDTISDDDTAGVLLERLAYSGADLLVRTMDGLESGTLTPKAQPEEGTYAPKILTADARVDWAADSTVIDRAIRAHTPAPGAWTMRGEERFKLGPVTSVDSTELAPGQVAFGKNEVRVGTGTRDVVLSTIQAPGKKMMNAADWARGLANDVRAEGMTFE